MNENDNNQSLEIRISDEVLQGIYSNLAIVQHSASEFVLDFAQLLPGKQGADVRARILLTPDHLKRFYAALQENITKYEAKHGTIRIAGDPSAAQSYPPIGFN